MPNFEFSIGNLKLIEHSINNPCFFVGRANEYVNMYRGNFSIKEKKVKKIPLSKLKIQNNEYVFGNDSEDLLKVVKNFDTLEFIPLKKDLNRLWIKINSTKDEKIFGLGEQFSYVNLKGKKFPIWVSEPGVGRNKKYYITWLADISGKAGGNYYTTNFPQPYYLSSKGYSLLVEGSSYMNFDFTNNDYIEIEIWDFPKIKFFYGESYKDITEKFTSYVGKQPILPDWALDGIILGIQGGTDTLFKKLEIAKKYGVKVSGVWCQDWVGKKVTSFGKRLFWDWKWNKEMYPNLGEKIKYLKENGIRFLGYINPYLVSEGTLYKEALANDFLVKNSKREPYLIDFGEFYGGIVDLTNPQAYEWYKQVIIKNLIEFGLDGWMADFGEYLPYDSVLYQGDPKKIHNFWPVLWSKLNYEALKESGKIGEILFFVRSGFTGFQKYIPLMWAGDQLVNWSKDDGIPSVVTAFLSSAISGVGVTHCDIGGYTSLFNVKRTPELFMRWVELSAFSPVMRTHETNRPDSNIQFDSSDEILKHLSRMVEIHSKLKSYIKFYLEEYQKTGTPLIYPVFFEYKNFYVFDEYLFGRDLLVAPVLKKGKKTRKVKLPEDEWIHLWSGKTYSGGEYEIESKLGYPPVFYRKGSKFSKLFENIGGGSI
jgi:alpha-glucosidase